LTPATGAHTSNRDGFPGQFSTFAGDPFFQQAASCRVRFRFEKPSHLPKKRTSHAFERIEEKDSS
jgi:hypothetical protein